MFTTTLIILTIDEAVDSLLTVGMVLLYKLHILCYLHVFQSASAFQYFNASFSGKIYQMLYHHKTLQLVHGLVNVALVWSCRIVSVT